MRYLSGRVQFDLVSKVFLMVISGKHVPYKCVKGGTSEGAMSNVLEFEIISARGRNEKVEQYIRNKTRKIVIYSSVSRSPTLGRNEKVESNI